MKKEKRAITFSNCLAHLKEEVISLLKEELGCLYLENPQEGYIEVSFTKGSVERGTFDFLFVAGNCCPGIILKYNQDSILLIKRWFANMASNPFNEEACQKRRERLSLYWESQSNHRYYVDDYFINSLGHCELCKYRRACNSPKEAIKKAREISKEFSCPVRVYLPGGKKFLEIWA